MKEIPKVVQKLSREQESVAGGGAGGGAGGRTNRYKNIKSPPIYQGDLIMVSFPTHICVTQPQWVKWTTVNLDDDIPGGLLLTWFNFDPSMDK